MLIFAVAFVRSAKPATMMPCVNFTVVVVVTSAIGPTLPSMPAATDFAAKLLLINVIGLAISLALGSFVCPMTNRRAYEKDVRTLVERIGHCLDVRTALLRDSLSHTQSQDGNFSKDWPSLIDQTAEKDIESSMAALLATFSDMQANMSYVGSELTVGHLDGADLERIHTLLTEVLKPVVGLMSCMDHSSKMPIDSAVEKHRQALSVANLQATRASRLLADTLRYGLEILKLSKPKAAVSHREEAAGAGLGRLATLELELQDLVKMFAGNEKGADTLPVPADGLRDDEAQQTLFLLTFQVCGYSLYRPLTLTLWAGSKTVSCCLLSCHTICPIRRAERADWTNG